MELENEYIEEEELIERLNRIAMRVYGKHYGELCESRQRTTMTLYNTGDF